MGALMEQAQAFATKVVAASDELQTLFSSQNNLVPHMQWEKELGSLADLSKDQLRFTLAMFASCVVGFGIRGLRSPTARHLYALVTGLLLTYYPFGLGIVHALPPVLLTYMGMWLAPKHSGVLAWWINFPYLIYLHVVNASGHNWMQGVMDFTGCEMVLVLKTISLAMCYQDYHRKKKEDMTPYQVEHAVSRLPGPLQYLSYVFCLGNLLSGPSFEYSEYKQFMELKGVWDPSGARAPPGVLLPSLSQFAQAILFMGSYVFMLPRWNRDTLFGAWYLAQPFYVKLVSQFLVGMTNQLKYCFAWKLSEASLTFAGLNFEGYDAKTGKARWGRCANVHFFSLLLCDSARTVPQFWNIGTGKFLRRYVYERITPAGKKPGFPQLLLTQMTSAIWHGLYPGYQLFFCSTALWIYFSTLLWKAEQQFMSQALQNSLPWRVIKIMWTNYVLNYMALAFMILDLDGSLAVWASTKYWSHCVMLVGCVLGSMFVTGPKKAAKAAKAE